MKVVAKVTVIDRILQDIARLHRERREPDFIAVTPDEYRELRSDARAQYMVERPHNFYVAAGPMTATDIVVKSRLFELRPEFARSGFAPHVRVLDRDETLQGLPLFIVPKEYMPI